MIRNSILYILILFSFISFSQDDEGTVVPYNQSVEKVQELPPRHFEEDFQDDYNSAEFNYSDEIVVNDEASWWERLRERIRRWFNDLFYSADGIETGWSVLFKYLAIAAVLVFVFLILRTFFKGEFTGIFRRSKSISVSDVYSENIHEVDFSKLVADAKAANDYRIAVRFYYLWLLKVMSEKKIIKWHIDKTNTEYLYEIKNPVLKEDFRFLSYVFDYCWYGEFEINEAEFEQIERSFIEAINNKYE